MQIKTKQRKPVTTQIANITINQSFINFNNHKQATQTLIHQATSNKQKTQT